MLNVLPHIWQVNLLTFSVTKGGGGGGEGGAGGYSISGDMYAVSSGLGFLGYGKSGSLKICTQEV